MLKSLVIVLSVLQLLNLSGVESKTWAFLAATSNGWINYRHQADLCHAYQILIANGIPKENIVTMLYDDIAFNSQNKNKGVIINAPGGPNVYKGVEKDYTGQDVTVENFFHVLEGNKEAMKGIGTGRVIESGPNDHIFVYIVDHGDTGMLLFPNDEYMYAHNLTQHLRKMKQEKLYKKMLMYVEACKAGSMFDNIIDDNLHVFITTASATDEFSWARYCDTIDTCLGDYYSTMWMEHLDLIRDQWSLKYTTLFKQFKYTRTSVVKSHVNIYGDFRLGYDQMSKYLGDGWQGNKSISYESQLYSNKNDDSVVSTKDLAIYMLEAKIKNTNNDNEQKFYQQELHKLLNKRHIIDTVVREIMVNIAKTTNAPYTKIVENTKLSMKEEHFPCYVDLINLINNNCINTYKNGYITRHFYKLANLCIIGHDRQEFIKILKSSCDNNHKSLLNTI